MRIGFASASATSAACALAGDAVDGRAQPRLLALRAARLRPARDRWRPPRARATDGRGHDDTSASTGLPARRSSSRTRWLTTRLEPPGGIDTP